MSFIPKYKTKTGVAFVKGATVADLLVELQRAYEEIEMLEEENRVYKDALVQKRGEESAKVQYYKDLYDKALEMLA